MQERDDEPETEPPEGGTRRRHARVDLPLLVQYRFGALEEPRIDYTLNVSQSGLFIITDDAHPVGTGVFVQVTTRDGAHFLQGEGKVVRAVDGGYAIELTGFDAAARKILDDLVLEAIAAQENPAVGPATRRARRS
jgi:hypothetical protein